MLGDQLFGTQYFTRGITAHHFHDENNNNNNVIPETDPRFNPDVNTI